MFAHGVKHKLEGSVGAFTSGLPFWEQKTKHS